MIRGPERQTNYWTASRWLQLGMSAVVISLLALWLLQALEETEVRAEALMVELTERNMRTGLALAMGEALLHGREREIASWAGANPVRWLGHEPQGYRGECGRPAQELGEGEWCFDRERRELVYRPRHDIRRQPGQGAGGKDVLRWRVVATQPAGRGLDAGLRVEYVTARERVLE